MPAYPPRLNRAPTGIQAIAADAGATIALTTDAVLERIGGADGCRLRTWTPCAGSPPTGRLTGRIGATRSSGAGPPITGDTLAFLQYTSGSTGTPKGVMLSHANLLHNSAVIAYAFEHTRSSSGVFWLPSYHDMGLIGGILQPLYIGRPNMLMSPMAFLQKPVRWLQAISRYRGDHERRTRISPTTCACARSRAEERETLDLSSWTVAFNGAEPVRADTLERFAETFAPCGFRPEAFYPCYGLAEATLMVSGGHKTVAAGRALLRRPGAGSRPRAAEGGRRRRRPRPGGLRQAMPDQRMVIVDPETG